MSDGVDCVVASQAHRHTLALFDNTLSDAKDPTTCISQELMQTVACELTYSDHATCNIFLMPTHEVEIEKLPKEIQVQSQWYNTATLSCQHTFHPSALFLHFLVTDMRCPTCRQGLATKMHVQSIPSSCRAAFLDKSNEITRKHESLTMVPMFVVVETVQYDMPALEADLGFAVELFVGSHRTYHSQILNSRIRPILDHVNGQFVQYVTEQRFQRQFSNVLRTHAVLPDVTIRFSIHHPLIPDSIRTNLFDLSSIPSMASENIAVPLYLYTQSSPLLLASLLFSRASLSIFHPHQTTFNATLLVLRDSMLATCIQYLNLHYQRNMNAMH